MGKYPEAEDRDSTQITHPDTPVIDFETYRRRREIVEHDTSANLKPRDAGEKGAGARNAPVEDNRQG